MYTVRFMFDWGAIDSRIWSNIPENAEKIGLGLLNLGLFNISYELKQKIENLCAEFQTALNWDEPQSGLIWNKTQVENFKKRAQAAYDEFVSSVGDKFIVENLIDKSL